MHRAYVALAWGALFVASSCTASAGASRAQGSGGNPAGSGGPSGQGGQSGGSGDLADLLPQAPTSIPAADPCTTGQPGPRRLRRLSASELTASIHTIFKDPKTPVATVFSDPSALGFAVDANALLVQGLNASQLMDNAEAVATWAVSNDKVAQFAPCTTVDEACARQLVEAFGRRAFRAPLGDSDPRIGPYVQLFMAESSFPDAAQAVISAMLQSPYFLYRGELGSPSGASFELTPFEIASSLAYLVTGDAPDDLLISAASSVAAGGLTIAAMLDQQAARLLDPSGATHATAVMGFMKGWLGLDRLYTTAKNQTVYMLSNDMRDNMATETQDLIQEAFDGGGSFASLLLADHTFLNQDLATFYGLDPTGLTSAFSSVPIVAGMPRDPGLLAHATILNGYARPDTSSPTQRGHLVRSRLLCQAVPPPPANVDTTFKATTTALTTRQHVENEHSLGGCDTCHKLMDPIGFGFERYDGFGRHRDSENGVAIDATGTIVDVNPREGSPTFDGLSGKGGLGAYLAGSDDVRQCLVRYWSYYSYGAVSWAQDACTYDAISAEASGKGFALREVLMAIIHAPNFTRRVQDR